MIISYCLYFFFIFFLIMLTNLIDDDQPSIPIIILAGKDALDIWLKKHPKRVKNWVLATGFEANEGTTCLIADVTGNIEIEGIDLG